VYTFGRVLGHGAYGTVYAAVRVGGSVEVAVKQIAKSKLKYVLKNH
jgi:serine/threonine protein kinase